MSEASTPAASEITNPPWRQAWRGVWSPPVAWVGSLALLWMSGREFVPWLVATIVGGGIAVCGLLGLFTIVPTTLDVCIAVQDRTMVSSRERFRLFLLGLVGTGLGLVGFGCLALLGAVVMFFSPMKGFQTPG
jgi:hypothetical protein